MIDDANMSATNSTGIIKLNVGGTRFVTSRQTLTWIPDSFFQSLLSGRIPSLKDEDGAIFIDRDPDLFKPILNYLRSREVQLNNCNVKTLKHEAEFYGITPLVRRLTLCEDLKNSSCGSLLFSGLIPPPNQAHMTSHDLAPAASFPSLPLSSRVEMTQVIQIESHGNCIAAAYPQYVCLYNRVKESRGWELVFTTPYLERPPQKIAVNAKVIGNGLGDKMLAYSTGFMLNKNTLIVQKVRGRLEAAYKQAGNEVKLWTCTPECRERASFDMKISVDGLFFIGSQLVALSYTGKVAVWQSMTQHWQVQELAPICSYDIAGSFLLLGCSNGSIYHIDMEKFPLRMKDNDLLITQLFEDPLKEPITSLSVYLTPNVFSGSAQSWVEIAFGTKSGIVRVIVQHPENVGQGLQVFRTFVAHTCPVIKIVLGEKHLITVCADNHVRSWSVARFRGCISTQPGSTSGSSFKVLSLDGTSTCFYPSVSIGPFGERDNEQVFVQRVVPETDKLFVRLSSNGQRVCVINAVDGSNITCYNVHEFDSIGRAGSRTSRVLISGHSNGGIQLWDLTAALDIYSQRSPTGPIEEGPTQQELLELLQQCEISQSRSSSAMSSRVPSPSPSLISLVFPNLKQLHNTGSSNSSINRQITPKQSLSTLSLSSHSVNTVCDATSFQPSSGLTRQASIHSHVLSIKQKDDMQETMVNFEMKVENTSISDQNRTRVPLSRTESDGSVVSNRDRHSRPTIGRSASSVGRPASRASVNSSSNSTTPHVSRPGSSSGPRSSDYFSLCNQEEGLSFDC